MHLFNQPFLFGNGFDNLEVADAFTALIELPIAGKKIENQQKLLQKVYEKDFVLKNDEKEIPYKPPTPTRL